MQRAWFALIVSLAFGFLAWGPNGLAHVLRDADSYWHVAVGRYIWTTGKLPTYDPFSHSAAGKHWIQHEWLSDLILSAVHAAAGWAGLVALALFSTVLALGIATRFLLQRLSGLQVLMIILLAAMMMQGHVLARPHVFAWVLMAAWAVVLTRLVDEQRTPPLWLPAVILLWANMHGSFMLALGVVGLLGLEAMAAALGRPDRNRVIGRWVLVGALCGLAALVTPDSIWNVLHILHLQSQTVQLSNIGEWQPPNFGEFSALLVWLGLLLAVTWSLGARFSLARVALVLILIHMSLKHLRHAEWLGLIAPLVLASGLAASIPRQAPEADPLYRLGPKAHALCRLLPVLAVVVYLVALVLTAPVPDPKNTPSAALAAARAEGLRGKVLNDYDFGGFLIYSGVPTFADGRSDLYGDEFLEPYFGFLKAPTEEGLRMLADKYDLEWTLLKADSPPVKFLDTRPEWTQVYKDEVAAVHRRATPRAP